MAEIVRRDGAERRHVFLQNVRLARTPPIPAPNKRHLASDGRGRAARHLFPPPTWRDLSMRKTLTLLGMLVLVLAIAAGATAAGEIVLKPDSVDGRIVKNR